MLTRELCPICHVNPIAVNYIKDGVTHYRNSCNNCIRKGKKLKAQPPLWKKAGYKKKPQCEICGFKLEYPSQSVVYHVDGNLQNVSWHNLKTVCLNCQQKLYHSRVGWKAGPIRPDF